MVVDQTLDELRRWGLAENLVQVGTWTAVMERSKKETQFYIYGNTTPY